jgi:ssRNA-specific RNase YbeY (16S rRNA maturation enzyme)
VLYALARLLTLPFALAFVASFLTGLAFHGFLHLPGFLHYLGASEIEIGMVRSKIASIQRRPNALS